MGSMATRQYYQRVGVWDSVQREPLGKRLYDDVTQRWFRYVQVLGSTDAAANHSRVVLNGSPVGVADGVETASQWVCRPNVGASDRMKFAGIAIITDASTEKLAAATKLGKKTSGYCWLMEQGMLGQHSTSKVYNLTVRALCSNNMAADVGGRWSCTATSFSKFIDISTKSTGINQHIWIYSAGINSSVASNCEPHIDGFIKSNFV